MVITLVILAVLTGLFAGYATHQRQELTDAQDELQTLRIENRKQSVFIATLKTDIRAHETSIEMIMGEVVKNGVSDD